MKTLLSLLLSVLLLTACGESNSTDPVELAKSRITQITPSAVVEKHLGKNVIIDVREADEVLSGMIPNAIHIPLSSLQTGLPKYLQSINKSSKDQEIVLYCRSGNRSAVGTDALQQVGYTNVSSMQGGMKAWIAEKNSVVIPTSK